MAAKSVKRRLSDLKDMVDNVPRLVNLRFGLVGAQLDGLSARVGAVEIKIDGLRTELQAVKAEQQAMQAKFEALPHALAQLLDERAKRSKRPKQRKNDRRGGGSTAERGQP